jgi:outer membrane protein
MQWWMIGLCLVLTGCRPEIAPFSLAPRCPTSVWAPGLYQVDAERQMDCELALGVPTLEPEAGDELGLSDLVCLALQNSPQTRETWAEARMAAAQYGESRATYFPDVTFTPWVQSLRQAAFYGRSQIVRDQYQDYGPQLRVSYLLFDFGAREANVRSFCEALVAANWTHNSQIQQLIQTVGNDYYAYLAAQEQMEAEVANVENARINLDATAARRQAGVADLSDELQARTQMAQQELNLLDAGQMVVKQLTQLTQDIGVSSMIPIAPRPLPKVIPVEQVTCSVEDLVAQAYHCRPDLLAGLADVRKERASLVEAVRNQFGSLDLTGRVGRTYFNSGEHDDYDYSSTIRLTVPLFKGWWYKNKVREAQANVEKARAQLRKLQVSISRDVVQSYQDFMIASDKVRVSEEYVKSAAHSYDSAFQKYKAGTTDYTTLFTALATLADARSALVSARQDWYTSLVDLSYAVGSLTKPNCRETKIRYCFTEGT